MLAWVLAFLRKHEVCRTVPFNRYTVETQRELYASGADQWLYRSRPLPYLRLYDDKIHEQVVTFHEVCESPTADDYDQEKNMLWSLHQDRFLDTLKGYHKVTLQSFFWHILRTDHGLHIVGRVRLNR